MARGKRTCKILKDIRRQIAQANDIEFITSECQYKGDCLGTCPRCEAEVRYLEQQLRSRQLMGKAVVLAGVSAGMFALSGCKSTSSEASTRDINPVEDSHTEAVTDSIDMDFDMGEVADIEDEDFDDKKIRLLTGDCPSLDDPITPAVENPDILPSFSGGDEALMEWVRNHIEYPELAAENGIQGQVVVRFKVLEDGSVAELVLVRTKDPDLDKEAIRIVKMLPKFIPGEKNGKPVVTSYTIPVHFRLPEE